MPALVVAIFSFVGPLISWLAEFFTKKFGIAVLAITAIGAVTVILGTSLIAMIDSIRPDGTVTTVLSTGFSLLPDNFEGCLATIVSAYIAKWIYQWKVRFIEMRGGIS